jgi:hypothetical protein
VKLNNTVLGAIVSIAAILGFLLRSGSVSPDPVKEARATWQQQLEEVRAGRSTAIVMPDLPLSSVHLPELGTVTEKVTELNLSGLDLGEGIPSIALCSHLRILHLRTEVGDAEITALTQLRELAVLDLPLATGVTDVGLQSLEGHPSLKLVRLRSPLVTDAGLSSFARMPALRWLHLMEVPVTDAGLGVFREMPSLESLYLDGDRATDGGLSALVQARPDLHFHRDQLHLSTDPRREDGHRD